jgi:hypothetical protein
VGLWGALLLHGGVPELPVAPVGVVSKIIGVEEISLPLMEYPNSHP